jgi:hypothetical protein
MNERMKALLVSGALILSAVAVRAQRHDGPPPFGAPMELMGFEGMHGGKVVKGAPFSATATSETTETLQDGSVLHRTSQVSMYRDSQGRSRHEVTLSGFGPTSASGGPKKVVMISDPVAAAHYMLDADQKIAHQMPFHEHGGPGGPGGPGAGANAETGANFESRMQEHEQKDIAAGLLKKESLGTQTINGVVAEGTRTTHIIPVGQIGNEKPLSIVSERWYSADLQIVLKSTRTDPRTGTTTYTVTSLQRSEPSATMFTVPAGYTVQTGGPGRGGRGGPGPVAPPPSVD